MKGLTRILIALVILSLATACSGGLSELDADATAQAAVAEALAAIPPTNTPQPSSAPSIITVVHTAISTQIIEVPVTREVEVTRIVLRVVTATPTSTVEPTKTPTNIPTPAAPFATLTPSSPDVALLASMKALRKNIQLMTNDNPRVIACTRTLPESVATNYEAVLGYPEYNTNNASAIVQDAYNRYRQAIEIIRSTNKDLYQFCIDWLAGTSTDEFIPFQIWGSARQGVNDALSVLEPGIAALEGD